MKNSKARSKEGHTDYKAWTFSPEGKGDTILKCHITVVFITYSLWNTERLKKKKKKADSHKNHTDYLGPMASPVVQWLRSKETACSAGGADS